MLAADVPVTDVLAADIPAADILAARAFWTSTYLAIFSFLIENLKVTAADCQADWTYLFFFSTYKNGNREIAAMDVPIADMSVGGLLVISVPAAACRSFPSHIRSVIAFSLVEIVFLIV